MSQNTTKYLENLYVGVIYSTVPWLFLIPYLVILKIINTDRDLKDNACYRIMYHMGVADVIQLGIHLTAGPFTICQCVGDILNKILGGILNGVWMSVMPLTTVLAINRYLVMTKPNTAHFQFTAPKVTFYLCLCWLYALLYILAYMTPWAGVMYFAPFYTWGYDGSKFSGLVQSIEFITVGIQLVIQLALYMGCVYSMKKMQALSSSARRREVRLMIQAVIIFAYTLFANILWHTYSYWLPETKWTYMTINFLWIGVNGNNVAVYLIFNKTVRRKFLHYVRNGNEVEPSSSTWASSRQKSSVANKDSSVIPPNEEQN